ncbi:parathyroid hormone-like hormone b isoform X2 [Triplophysa rosa]|uniref:Parathyroid hormone-related peptide 2 n=2 Tax=Triplophysa rosa TaxID=992332 RepID=A0A9W7W922_TRIRA|nr:parathyroid hormone-like hormone b isoform X2 [Triplophysa rosa]XP_057183443.1 parathyroid hormone-like hormone b isoform X2 [Triplophysa rosa]XP_057183444.1 parathyroid hormone-like hormone b isoform X2 [Triplophysa rosa]XP_057183445.1 parathyroid hormone-like hormone b isoform X2 [Triplophysa rosa]KAI7790635.1 parathyroid hormone-related peptide 2 precursor [Triplophysa rosa]
MLRHWSFAVFLLTVPIPVEPKPTNSVSRQRRSVSHAQMMHDRGRSLHERKRRLWIHELLEQVHTAQMWDSPHRNQRSFRNIPWAIVHPPKHPSSTKIFPLSFQLDTVRTSQDLTQQTSNSLRYEESVRKRKRKVCSERWRDPDRRDWGCATQTQMHQD